VVVGQVVVAVAGGLICQVVLGPRAAVSALIGGGIGAVATVVQVAIGLRAGAGDKPQAIERGLVRGSVAKLVLTAVLLVAVLRNYRVAPGPLFVTYVLTFVVYWLGLARALRSRVQERGGASLKGP